MDVNLPNVQKPHVIQAEIDRRQFERLKIAAEDSLYEFAVQAWKVVEPKHPFKDNWHIKAICDHLQAVSEGKIHRLVINIPPRHMKSLLVSVFWPVWTWIKQPAHRWLFASYAQNLSKRDNVKSRRLLQSDWFTERWGDRFKLTGDQNEKLRYENDKTGYRIASSVDGALTGDGGDTVVIDDPHNVREAESDLVRQAACEWFDGAVSTRLNDPEGGSIVVIMQRVHDADLCGHIFSKKERALHQWNRLVIPARFESQHPTLSQTELGFTDPRTEEGELLWPNRISEEVLTDLENDLGPYKAAGQLQQRPAPAEGGLVQRDWFQWYDLQDLPDNAHRIASSWDLPFKKTAKSDFVGGVAGHLVGGNLYIVDGINERMNFPQTVLAFKAFHKKHPKVREKFIEEKANGSALIDTLKNEIPGMQGINPEKDKIERLSAVAWCIKSGNVFLPRNHPISEIIIHQCCTAPNILHDDVMDAFTQLLTMLLGVMDVDKLYDAAMDKADAEEAYIEDDDSIEWWK